MRSRYKITDKDGIYFTTSTIVEWIPVFTTRHKTKSDYQVWQEGYHPELIVSDEMLRQKMEYIHYNPIKRGLVSAPEHWLHSSARNYLLEDDSVIQLDPLPV